MSSGIETFPMVLGRRSRGYANLKRSTVSYFVPNTDRPKTSSDVHVLFGDPIIQ